jgi:hypothetical protein
MLYTDNLEEIIFHRHEMFASDELIVLSGYVGPKPIERLKTLPFQSKVIYGMYGAEGIKRPLHNSLINLQNSVSTLNIFYSNLPVHSKCYAWRNNGQIVHALVGSANFSTSGLTTPYREILAETTFDTFNPLNEYIKKVLNIKIRIQDIKSFPELIPPKQVNPLKFDGRGKIHRHNDYIEIIWDDGVCMTGLFFGSQEIDGIKYPKQVSSFPAAEMGKYLRQRLNVPEGQPVRKFHLDRYGRDTIGISLINEGVYKFDFSV